MSNVKVDAVSAYNLFKQGIPALTQQITEQVKLGNVTVTQKVLDKSKDTGFLEWIKAQKIPVSVGGFGKGPRTGLLDAIKALTGLSPSALATATSHASEIVKHEQALDDILATINRESSWCYLRGEKKADAPDNSGVVNPNPVNASSSTGPIPVKK